MSQVEYEELVQRVEQARQIIGIERAIYLERVYNLMESGLTLLGVTAVEDRLQEGVQETLECLQVAGIKVGNTNAKNKLVKLMFSYILLLHLGMGTYWRQSRDCREYSVSVWPIQEWYRSAENIKSNDGTSLPAYTNGL